MIKRITLVILVFIFAFLAGNLAKAADVNGYTAQYECRADGPNCNVDVDTYTTAACAQTITTADSLSTIESKLDTGSSPICVTNGDYTGKGTIDITASGTSGAYRVMRYYRSGDTDDDPWDQTSGNQAKFNYLNITGQYWIIHRLTFPELVASGTNRIGVGGRNIINRNYIRGGGSSEACYSAISTEGYTNGYLVVQNNVIGGLRRCTGGSPVAVQLEDGNDYRVVNNEIFDWCEHPIQVGYNGTPQMTGVVIENNDLYVDSTYYAGDGDAAAGWLISVKNSATAASPTQIIQNRLWGTRPQDGAVCGTPDSGHAMGFNASDGADNSYHIVKNNIIMDSQGAIAGYNYTISNISIIGNLIYKIGEYATDQYITGISFYDMSATEVYLNTFILNESGPNSDNGVLGQWNSSLDIRCNTFISSERSSTDSVAASSIMDYNVFLDSTIKTFNGTATNIDKTVSTRANSTAYNLNDYIRTTATAPADGTAGDFIYKVTTAGTSDSTPPSYTTTLGGSTTDGTMVVKAVRGPSSFYRKLRTGAELVYIPYERVHNTAVEYGYCPNTTGNRTGIGISNQTGTW